MQLRVVLIRRRWGRTAFGVLVGLAINLRLFVLWLTVLCVLLGLELLLVGALWLKEVAATRPWEPGELGVTLCRGV